jgi:hypothetical protein
MPLAGGLFFGGMLFSTVLLKLPPAPIQINADSSLRISITNTMETISSFRLLRL